MLDVRWTATVMSSYPMIMATMAAAAALVLVAGAAASPIGKHGCETMCGGVRVPYPFGIGPQRCSAAAGFNLTCLRRGSDTPRLLLGDDGVFEVREISLENRTVRVTSAPIFSDPGTNASAPLSWRGDRGLGDRRWQYSLGISSELVVLGCNVQVTMLSATPVGAYGFTDGCWSLCNESAAGHALSASDVRSYARGFCTVPVFAYLASYAVELTRFGNGNGTLTGDDALPVYALLAETGWFSPDRAVELLGLERPPPSNGGGGGDLSAVPLVLDWTCRNDGTCNTSVSANSNCSSTDAGEPFYVCNCTDGYQGNPYLTDGCQDIDECKRAKEHGCFGECRNTPGSFDCRCAHGLQGNATQPNGCLKPVKNTGLIIGLSVGICPSLVLLVLGGFIIIRMLKHHRAEKLKKKFFCQNRGQLLQQLVSQRSDIGERMIITLKEIEKATNNFDQARKLGNGGHGTVYKGILSDLHVVAIKKSNIMVQREIDEFINEVAILSQINHRNIVKLHGCCLETEVPLLAYEFVSNGTLSDHLHNESPSSIPWVDRLRIAIGVGRAIAYLHSAVSVPVIHRDIKSSNILLDDALTAKVSDFGASRYIHVDRTGIPTTAVQGTIGYLDPMYYYTGRLSEKSDVYSFGVLLVELLTRKMPIMYRSSQGDGLAVQFVGLLEDGRLVDILDSQVVEEGGCEVDEVATLAASCIKLTEDERPTMRQVEMALEGIHENMDSILTDLGADQHEESYTSSTRSMNIEELSR